MLTAANAFALRAVLPGMLRQMLPQENTAALRSAVQ
jgi:hypothetical protein